ncbi:hypothetical protein PLICRDRAFT_515379 [Plicaturopsis crispa FD-325 SS-3]|nr:hypothetical protein PLICRDRAFT_515379 [Plicaturopsis crispa FD-325 SS-3]
MPHRNPKLPTRPPAPFPKPPSRNSLQARRLRMILFSFPLMVGASVILFKRIELGEPRRTLPRDGSERIPPNHGQSDLNVELEESTGLGFGEGR